MRVVQREIHFDWIVIKFICHFFSFFFFFSREKGYLLCRLTAYIYIYFFCFFFCGIVIIKLFMFAKNPLGWPLGE